MSIADAVEWIECAKQLPPVDVVVMTKVDDAALGPRKEESLKRYQRDFACNSLWFVPDGSRYVYYKPTHWHYI